MEKREETKKEIFEILEQGFYPYLRECDFNERIMDLVMVAKKKLPVEKIVEILNESEKNLYHKLKGTDPVDYSQYL